MEISGSVFTIWYYGGPGGLWWTNVPLSSPTSEAPAWHLAGAPIPCRPHVTRNNVVCLFTSIWVTQALQGWVCSKLLCMVLTHQGGPESWLPKLSLLACLDPKEVFTHLRTEYARGQKSCVSLGRPGRFFILMSALSFCKKFSHARYTRCFPVSLELSR